MDTIARPSTQSNPRLPGIIPGHAHGEEGTWCPGPITTDALPAQLDGTGRCHSCGCALTFGKLLDGDERALIAWPLDWSGEIRARWWLAWQCRRATPAPRSGRRQGPRRARWRACKPSTENGVLNIWQGLNKNPSDSAF